MYCCSKINFIHLGEAKTKIQFKREYTLYNIKIPQFVKLMTVTQHRQIQQDSD